MYPCDFCHEPAAHLTDSGQAIVCDECILSRKLAFCGLTEPANPGIDASTIGKITVRAAESTLRQKLSCR